VGGGVSVPVGGRQLDYGVYACRIGRLTKDFQKYRQTAPPDMGINLGGGDALVTQQGLDVHPFRRQIEPSSTLSSSLSPHQRWLTVQSSFRSPVIPPVQCTHNERSAPVHDLSIMSPPCR
jgi:hypothetical protein